MNLRNQFTKRTILIIGDDIQLLDHLISVEYAQLTPFDLLPIASDRLKKHIDVVRKKLFSLQREKQLRGE